MHLRLITRDNLTRMKIGWEFGGGTLRGASALFTNLGWSQMEHKLKGGDGGVASHSRQNGRPRHFCVGRCRCKREMAPTLKGGGEGEE
ncbi:hypothetical protein JTE90_025689 [Oedothorax gibbosus]|uniref:Uncharacterized protein n=1 Tax=Oedothorax gibbosus TaxID=931172 RepID=A0AAV6UCD6_9ARAC|nr:hypothetical protein JTE90_025689 [Oedothorax gibbosus]